MTGRLEQQPFPPFVTSAEDKRRWELVTRAVVFAFGWQLGEQLDTQDRALIFTNVRLRYNDDSMATGDGTITGEEREKLRAMGAL